MNEKGLKLSAAELVLVKRVIIVATLTTLPDADKEALNALFRKIHAHQYLKGI